MKTKLLMLSACFVTLISASSCNSCSDSNRGGTNADTESTDNASSTNNGSIDDINSGNRRTGGNDHNPVGGQTGTTERDARTGTGYSAPDGTDAENSDGDYYTRNDTTQQPTGPPIK